MKIKNFFALTLISSLPMIGYAADLTVVNNTDKDSTSIINHTSCSSSVLGDKGVTHPHSTNVISGTAVRLACLTHPHDCVADVYMSNNCTGDKVATITFDVASGIKSIEVLAYRFSGAGFKIQIDQL